MVCCLSSWQSASNLVQAMYKHETDGRAKNSNRLAHVLLLHGGNGVFFLLTTAISSYTRFPMEECMFLGDCTSAFFWLNLDDASWAAFQETSPAAVEPAHKKQKTKSWHTLSKASMAGMQLLSRFRVCCLMAQAASAPEWVPRVQNFVYVKPKAPLQLVGPTAGGEGVDQTTAVTVPDDTTNDSWRREIEAFVAQFSTAKHVTFIFHSKARLLCWGDACDFVR
jgi:hypothetical protein